MRIGFWTSTPKLLDIQEIDTGRTICGGTEREELCLAKELHPFFASKIVGHPIYIFGNVKERGGIYNHALFFRYEDLAKITERDPLDVLIVTRAHELLSPRRNRFLFSDKRPKKVVLWSGDSFDQPNNEILYDRLMVDNLDAIVLKSEWQKETWLQNFMPLQNKPVHIIRKGLDVENLTKERSVCEAPRFIYASTAFRGLELFPKLWPKIKEQIPEATLDCYTKTTLYLDDNPQDVSYLLLYQQIEKLPGVKIKEPLPQTEFFKVLPSYYAMLYPNTFEETVCGAALESMASGVPVIASARAGLVETIKAGKGVLIPGDPYSAEYAEKFVDATVSLWNSKGARSTMSKEGFKKIREKYNIKETAKEWFYFLNTLQANPSSPANGGG